MTSDKSRVLIRVDRPEIKAALAMAAADEQRSVSSLIGYIMTEWLREKGYLAPTSHTASSRDPHSR